MTPFDGTLIWIWNLTNCDAGDFDAIATRVKGAGCRGVIVKATDGGNWFPQGLNGQVSVTTIVSELRSRGLVVNTWGYCYDYAEPAEEAKAIETITIARPDAHVLDVEQEDEDQRNTAADAILLATNVKNAVASGFPLAYSPLPAISAHVRLPYRQFTDAGLAMLPQLYWTGLRWTPQYTVGQFYQGIERYALDGQPIYPVYEDAPGNRPTDEDLTVFLQMVKAKGATGISVWSYEHLDDAGWERVKAAAAVFPASGYAPPVADLAAFAQSRLDYLSGAVTQAIAALQQALATLPGDRHDPAA